jgi:hypothetical protein
VLCCFEYQSPWYFTHRSGRFLFKEFVNSGSNALNFPFAIEERCEDHPTWIATTHSVEIFDVFAIFSNRNNIGSAALNELSTESLHRPVTTFVQHFI